VQTAPFVVENDLFSKGLFVNSLSTLSDESRYDFFFRFINALLPGRREFYTFLYLYNYFMKHYRKYIVERWPLVDYIDMSFNFIRGGKQLLILNYFFAKDLEMRFISKLFSSSMLEHYYLVADFSTFFVYDENFEFFITNVFNAYKLTKIIFCDYNAQLLINFISGVRSFYMEDLDEIAIADDSYISFYGHFFQKALFQSFSISFDQFFIDKTFLVYDYYLWRTVNLDVSRDLTPYEINKNASLDLVYSSRFYFAFSNFRHFYKHFY
jgi:hypothetical protein